MSGRLASIAFAALLLAAAAPRALSQTARNSVSGAEVTGTFRMPFGGKFKGSFNEIRIAVLGKGRVRAAFDLSYPYTMSNGGLMANVGRAEGTGKFPATGRFSRPTRAGVGSRSNLPGRERSKSRRQEPTRLAVSASTSRPTAPTEK